MPVYKMYNHLIDFIESASFLKLAKLYLLFFKVQNSIDKQINEKLHKCYIQPSKSPVADPFFVIKKYDSELRLYMDYHALNNIIIKNHYSISRISNLINFLSQALIFTKIDLRQGHNNVLFYEENKGKIAFIIYYSLFEAIVMYFGFSNTPETLQAIMNDILGDLIHKGDVIVYLNHIFMFRNN